METLDQQWKLPQDELPDDDALIYCTCINKEHPQLGRFVTQAVFRENRDVPYCWEGAEDYKVLAWQYVVYPKHYTGSTLN